jgi:hypothetical protein
MARGGRAALHRYAAAQHHGPEPRRPDHQGEPGGNEKDLISVGHDCMPAISDAWDRGLRGSYIGNVRRPCDLGAPQGAPRTL